MVTVTLEALGLQLFFTAVMAPPTPKPSTPAVAVASNIEYSGIAVSTLELYKQRTNACCLVPAGSMHDGYPITDYLISRGSGELSGAL